LAFRKNATQHTKKKRLNGQLSSSSDEHHSPKRNNASAKGGGIPSLSQLSIANSSGSEELLNEELLDPFVSIG
jgi:hypothetical protein